jgi:hypothetical protein
MMPPTCADFVLYRALHCDGPKGGYCAQEDSMNVRVQLLLCFVALASFHAAFAQERVRERPKAEVFGSIAAGHVFRFDDRGYGNHFNFGAGANVAIWRGLRAGAEVNRTFGLDPTPAKCGSISNGPNLPPLPCVGSAREGVASATAASFTAEYLFGQGRVQPYLVGGLSIMLTEEFGSISIVKPNYVEFEEWSSKDTGIGPTFGAGLRIEANRRLSIRPELRVLDATALSRSNLSQLRVSLGVGYAW